MKPTISESVPLPDWSRRFADPIPMQNGKPMLSLRDAGQFIARLPNAEQQAPEWQTAAEMLLLNAEHGPSRKRSRASSPHLTPHEMAAFGSLSYHPH